MILCPSKKYSLTYLDPSFVGEEAGDQSQEVAHSRLFNNLEAEPGQESTSLVSSVLYSVEWPSHTLGVETEVL